jgi:hypothetical protein
MPTPTTITTVKTLRTLSSFGGRGDAGAADADKLIRMGLAEQSDGRLRLTALGRKWAEMVRSEN